jgi:hypothetical protein
MQLCYAASEVWLAQLYFAKQQSSVLRDTAAIFSVQWLALHLHRRNFTLTKLPQLAVGLPSALELIGFDPPGVLQGPSGSGGWKVEIACLSFIHKHEGATPF